MQDQNETYRSLAKKAGVSSGTVSELLTGTVDPRLLTVLSVAAVLGFESVESIFSDVELPTRSIMLKLAVQEDSARSA
jgi:DNA-binding XRE family transcriptional regulator